MDILTTGLAQDIVTRTMRIIPYNVNVMDAHGSIVASGNPKRVGELHAGALLALAKKLTVEIDDASARNMHGAQPGINLPLTVNGQVCGAVGLSGAPAEVRQFGELVRLTAEMILEQAHLTSELQRDSRYREAFLLNLIKLEPAGQADLESWGRRLGVNFERTQLILLLQLADPAAAALNTIQHLQLRMLARQPAALTAAVGPSEMAILVSYDAAASSPEAAALRQLQTLSTIMQEECELAHTLTMGIALPGVEGVAISYQSAQTAARVGRARDPRRNRYSYYDHALPVLLSGLGTGWQAAQLRVPMSKLRAQDKSRELLQRTLECWFAHDGHLAATADALHIHRNTLDYRLRRIGEITGLDLGKIEDRFLLYVSSCVQAAL